ncbi:hypothetical protein GCM10023116_48460 [Kistimonas scapharcae]|uniref:Uncharacterized protein n=1 Tax=Kistimonas scapharcae TaxID=1036133 RepID=A0ABP8VC56_9GAMM
MKNNTGSPIFTFRKDRNGRYTEISSDLAIAAGYDSPKQAIGKSDYDFYLTDHADICNKTDGETRDSLSGSLTSRELVRTIGGWVEVVVRKRLDREGGIVGEVEVQDSLVGTHLVNIQPARGLFVEQINDYLSFRELKLIGHTFIGTPQACIAEHFQTSIRTLNKRMGTIKKKFRVNYTHELLSACHRYALSDLAVMVVVYDIRAG